MYFGRCQTQMINAKFHVCEKFLCGGLRIFSGKRSLNFHLILQWVQDPDGNPRSRPFWGQEKAGSTGFQLNHWEGG